MGEKDGGGELVGRCERKKQGGKKVFASGR